MTAQHSIEQGAKAGYIIDGLCVGAAAWEVDGRARTLENNRGWHECAVHEIALVRDHQELGELVRDADRMIHRKRSLASQSILEPFRLRHRKIHGTTAAMLAATDNTCSALP
jgi:hypothetical protein